jgi:uncharacterized protein DUF5752
MKANTPFQFVTASYLVRIGNQKSTSLLDLQHDIENCSDASIFYHTFQSLGRHHFLTEGFSNDFAEWVFSACNRPALAEQLASLDIRDYVSLADLRGDLRRIVGDYCHACPREAQQSAFESFYFCETLEEEVSLELEAWTLPEFRDGLNRLGHASLQFHFITSRLRLRLRSNDFSQWLAKELGLKDLGRQVDQIDVYTNTLDSVRTRMIELIEREPVQ